MLDTAPDDLKGKDDMQDVLGPVGHRVAGKMKSSPCAAVFSCRIAPPAFTMGSEFELACRYLDRAATFAYTHATETLRESVGF